MCLAGFIKDFLHLIKNLESSDFGICLQKFMFWKVLDWVREGLQNICGIFTLELQPPAPHISMIWRIETKTRNVCALWKNTDWKYLNFNEKTYAKIFSVTKWKGDHDRNLMSFSLNIQQIFQSHFSPD